MPKPDSARYVWYNRSGLGRNQYASFRKTLDVSGKVKSAVINVFADTFYKLFVNGEFVEYGPVRFDPRFPLHDTHDIAHFLKPGTNVVAVLANYFGMKTFKAMPVHAGFVAWGSVETTTGAISLDTRADSWKCIEDKAYTYAPKLSFALNAGDRCAQSLEQDGWTTAAFDDSAWPGCVELEHQDSWGPLEPRNIPFMTGAAVPVHKVVRVLPLARNEQWYSFTVPAPNSGQIHGRNAQQYVAFQTWVHSPADQTVTAGIFFCDPWLNGEMLGMGLESVNKPMRYAQSWKLKAGWNHYGGVVKLYEDVCDLYIALPLDRGLAVSAVRDPQSDVVFRRSRVFTAAEYNPSWPYDPEETLAPVGGWIDVRRHETAHAPCRETSWDDYGEQVERLSPESLDGHVFRRDDYPHGFAVLLDIDHMHLAFPRVRLSGVAGATVDLTYSEHCTADGMHLRHSHNYQGGDSVRCSRDTVDFTPSHPKGMRYLKLTVRGAAGDVTLDEVSLRAARYPVEYKGAFRCSDPLLNEIWEMGRRTQAANMEDAYVDCSGRERGMYLRDTILQYHSNLAAFGDHALMHRCFQLYGQSPDDTGKFRAVYPNTGDYTIADFALNGLEGYYVYWQHTGDLERVRQDWDAILGNLAWFHKLADQRKDLLLDAEWDKHQGIKAHYGGFHGDLSTVKGHQDNTGVHCTFSCTYLIALQRAYELAALLGRKDDASALRKRIAVLRKSIQKFWDPKARKFGDNLRRKAHSVHANLFAIRAGVATKAQIAAVREYVKHELRSIFVNGYNPDAGVYCSPNFGFYILEGLYMAGLYETAENMMREGWGWALAQGMRTCPEYWRNGSSVCHAWSAGPTWFLSRHVLGVHYPEPGNTKKVAVEVLTDRVTYAEGAFPHPKGVVKVKWHMERGRRVFDYVRAPRGVEVVSVA